MVADVLCCQVEISATGRSFVHRSPTQNVSPSVTTRNNTLHLQFVARRGQNKKGSKEDWWLA